MKIITKNDIKKEPIHTMLDLIGGVYTGMIMPVNIPGIVIVSEDRLPVVMYCYENQTQWLNAREIGNAHLIKNPVRVKIETITTIAV